MQAEGREGGNAPAQVDRSLVPPSIPGGCLYAGEMMPDNPAVEGRIGLKAPLLSVRRFHSAISARGGWTERVCREEEGDGKQPNSQVAVVDDRVAAAERTSLPFYKPDLESGPESDPGVVPVVREQSPSRPKEGAGDASGDRPSVPPTLSPCRMRSDSGGAVSSTTGERSEDGEDVVTTPEKKSTERLVRVEDRRGDGVEEEEQEDGEAFSDALETLSLAESDFINCGVSATTGVGETAAATGNSGSCFSTDPQVRDFMMGRFLPAAQAIATETGPTNRKMKVAAPPPASPVLDGVQRRPLPFPYQSSLRSALRYPSPKQIQVLDQDEDEEDGYETPQLAMKGCGFLLPKFCLKSSFGVMDSVPRVKVKERTYRPSSQKHSTPDSWEAVYRHTLGHGHQEKRVENANKIITESCTVTFQSDSQPTYGLSRYRRSAVGRISPCRSEPTWPPFRERKGFIGFPSDVKIDSVESESFRNGNDGFWEVKPHVGSKFGSGSGSSVVEKTLYIDSVHKLEAPKSRSSSMESKLLTPADKDSDFAVRKEIDMNLEARGENKLQDDIPGVTEADITSLADRTGAGEERDFREKSKEVSVDSSEATKLEDRVRHDNDVAQPLLPPPLPKSPTESWLCRTLPVVSSKSPTPQTFLGMQFNTKKKTIQKSATDPIRTAVKASNMQSDQKSPSKVFFVSRDLSKRNDRA